MLSQTHASLALHTSHLPALALPLPPSKTVHAKGHPRCYASPQPSHSPAKPPATITPALLLPAKP